MECGLCKDWISHPSLSDLIDPILKLQEDIKKKSLQRLEYEGLHNSDDISKEGGRFYKNPQGFALHHFAYYPCFKCAKPYFGGQVRCGAGGAGAEQQNQAGAAGAGGQNQAQSFDASHLVCGGCSGVKDQKCPVHGSDFIEHKCQYCCSLASWFCWGTTHFCDSCHTKQVKGDYVSQYPKDKLPKCPGKDKCPLKIDHPPNGEAFILGCALCKNVSF